MVVVAETAVIMSSVVADNVTVGAVTVTVDR